MSLLGWGIEGIFEGQWAQAGLTACTQHQISMSKLCKSYRTVATSSFFPTEQDLIQLALAWHLAWHVHPITNSTVWWVLVDIFKDHMHQAYAMIPIDQWIFNHAPQTSPPQDDALEYIPAVFQRIGATVDFFVERNRLLNKHERYSNPFLNERSEIIPLSDTYNYIDIILLYRTFFHYVFCKSIHIYMYTYIRTVHIYIYVCVNKCEYIYIYMRS